MKLIGWTSFDSECQGLCVEDRQTMLDALNETLKVICDNGYLFSGETHQKGDCCVPVFDNGRCLKCSMRAWATLMSIAHTGADSDYMSYYMDYSIDKNVMPTNKVDANVFVIDPDDERLLYYYTNADLELAGQSASMGMQLMTFDKVVMVLYDLILQHIND